MNIHCLGINHRTAPIEVREKLWFSDGELPPVLASLKETQMSECALVSTCNRTELYYVPAGQAAANGMPLWQTLAAKKNATGAFREEHFYTYAGMDAVRQIYRVVSGIDSMVLGDVQIINQVKEAFARAQANHCTGILLNRLYNTALHVGKRARTETEIGEGAVSVSYAAAELASKIFEDLSRRTAMLVGAGETGKLTAKHLKGRNLGRMIFANRTREHAEELAAVLGGTVVDYERLAQELQGVDILISSVNSPTHVLTAPALRQAMKSRGNRPLFIIDIGVPRNVDPAANTIENVFLHDIDGLNQIIDGNLAHRRAETPKVERIIGEEAAAFEQWYASLDVSPTIVQLREAFEAIRSEEVGKHSHHFDPVTNEAVDMLTKRIINKILHAPMANLKPGTGEHGTDDTRTKIYFIRHLFGLDKHTHHDNP